LNKNKIIFFSSQFYLAKGMEVFVFPRH